MWKLKFALNVELKNLSLNTIKMVIKLMVNRNIVVIVKLVPISAKQNDTGKNENLLMLNEPRV